MLLITTIPGKMNKISVNILISLIVMILLSIPVFSASVNTSVKYISSTVIYIDAGSLNGIQKDDFGEIRRADEIVAKIQVSFISDNSASCKIIESFSDIRISDQVIIMIEEQQIVQDEKEPVIVDTIVQSPVSQSRGIKPRKQKKLSGRIGFQYYAQDNKDEFNYDFSQPSVSLNLRLNDIIDSHHDIHVKMRSRRNFRSSNTASSPSNEWDNRLYEISLNYQNPDSRLNYGFGRLLSNQISGMGYIDGIMLGYKLDKGYSVGFFGGSQPDMQTAEIQTDETKTGVYASFENSDAAGNHFKSTAAFAGKYVDGQINNEYLYSQTNYSIGRKLYLYQSAEISINRGWRKEAAGNSFQLSNILVNLRYNFTQSVSANVGYDNRQNVYTYYNRTTPDSLFDDALRQGYRVGANFKLPKNLRVQTTANFRTQNDGSNPSEYYSASVSTPDIMNTRTFASYRLAAYDNLYSSGLQNSFSLSRYFLRKLNVGLHFGQNSYNYKAYGESVVDNWVKFSGDYLFSSKFYTSAYYEIYSGNDFNSNRVFLDFGIRL